MSDAEYAGPLAHVPRETLTSVLETLPGAIFFLDITGAVVYANASARALIGAAPEMADQVLNQVLWASCPPANLKQLRTAITQACTGETVRVETMLHPKEGAFLHVEATITPYVGDDQHIAHLVMTVTNFTPRTQSGVDIPTLINATPRLIRITEADGSVDIYNQRWLDYTGMAAEEAVREGWVKPVHPDDQPNVLAMWQRVVQTGESHEVELRLRNGTTEAYRWFLVRAAPLRDADSAILKYMFVYVDINKQKQAEQRLRTSEEHWRVLAETMPQLVWTTLPDGYLDYCNQRICEYLQAPFEQIQGYGWRQFLHPDDLERVNALRHREDAEGELFEIEYRFRDGLTNEYRWFLVRAMAIYDERRQLIKWVGTCTDIHEKKQAEAEIKTLINTIPQQVWMMYADGRGEYCNQRWSDYTGLTFAQSQEYGWLQSMHPDDRDDILEAWGRATQTGTFYEAEYRIRQAATGEYRWFLARGMPLRDARGVIHKWFGTNTDIDERKQMEEALRQGQERARTLMESNIIGSFISEGFEKVIVDANDEFLDMTGYSREDLRQHRMSCVQMTPPECLAQGLLMREKLLQHQSIRPYEKEFICKDGSRLPVLVGAVLLKEYPMQTIYFVLDNSARKELEQRKDTFISMASHELRNPLTALKLQVSFLKRQLAKLGFQASVPALARMDAQINKITRLVEELLDVSKIQTGKLEYQQEQVELDTLVQEVVETMQHAHITHTLVVRGSTHAYLLGDRDRLGQIYVNLISNAIKYSPDAKTVEIDLSASDETATVCVCDHGPGIPREQRDRIFERFYRVVGSQQSAVPGLGMGLYIVDEIVRHYGGTISVESTVGKGSAFIVTFPREKDT